MSERYAVVGNPIKHSLSPQIHSAFAAQTGEDIVYSKQLVPLDGFADFARSFFAEGGRGLNVTVPFKLEAFELADTLTDRAASARAVNTLLLDEKGEILGDNTDGAGLVFDICNNLGWQIRGKKILLLGAGGAARGALLPLLAAQPTHLHIANRTAEKAVQLAAEFSQLGELSGGGLEALRGCYDLIINASSASLDKVLPPLPEGCVADQGKAYDMMYGADLTPFSHWAQAQGADVADGQGMLVEQAAESFFLWRGVRPKTTPVRAKLRQDLNKTSHK
ncbi:shikimate dehydrogenase [Microbulbifer sp. OS29]|uniref:Shikimate dehydrogenase (NADP(+)) n=1 Tax=Microbulbifer okhotskensis TaxID=2926617 RepID=A0A9X2J640_9GAMM|nr:shikimate dehydrogenase [Microbulbifer okhotskensis]MCO1333061.1 shikimate dehydrogenase [Microbulbifer okhotskensis]